MVSRSANLLAVPPGAGSGSAWTGVVATGALPDCGALVDVVWETCNVSVAEGTAPVDLQLPSATAKPVSEATSSSSSGELDVLVDEVRPASSNGKSPHQSSSKAFGAIARIEALSPNKLTSRQQSRLQQAAAVVWRA